MADAVYDPLSINLPRQTRLLVQKIPHNSPCVAELSNASSVRDLLPILSRLLAKPQLTELIATLFRPILLDLCARWIEGDDCTDDQLFAIAFLVEPQEELFPVLDRMLRKLRFQNGPLGSIVGDVPVGLSTIHSLLVTYYRIQQVNREMPDVFLWPLMPLSSIIWSNEMDNGAKLLAIRCYAIQSGMGEAERENLESEVLRGEPFGPDCPLEYGETLHGEKRVVDGWMLPVIERERVQTWRNDLPSTIPCEGYYVWEDGDTEERINESDLSPLVVNVHGVLLLRSALPTSRTSSATLVPTPTTTGALRSLATHISLRLPVLLTSAPSAGKSLFLSHLASRLHPQTTNQLITIHLADTSLDPRALLGSYVSSRTSSGVFDWKEGVLVRAMREGRWVVFEDVDKASSEVLGTIRPLIESMRFGLWIGQRAELDVPGRGRVVAADAFRVFATRSIRTSQQRDGVKEIKVPEPTFLGAHKFWEVLISPPTKQELQTILDTKYPKLRGEAALSLINLWGEIQKLGAAPDGRSGVGREVGVRELEKFCVRVESLLPGNFQFTSASRMDVDEGGGSAIRELPALTLSTIFPNLSLREDIFSEARDVFFGAGTLTAPARLHAESVARMVGNLLGFNSERQDWLISGRVPPYVEEKDVNGRLVSVCAGYTRLMVKSSSSVDNEMGDLVQSLTSHKRPFAMHKPAIMLLSRVARAVALCEPILLTGETGTGKTSLVTHLAGLLQRKLISLNLSHQSESGDLLGGFKPVDTSIPAGELMERWEELFGGTFSRRKNEKFEGEVRKALRDVRWGRVVGLWRESGRLALDRIRNKKRKGGGTGEVAEAPRKRRKVEQDIDGLKISEETWLSFLQDVDQFEVQHIQAKGKFAFDFIEGPLVKALRSGDWILLDEINLASPETLECITGLLHGPTASITLTEKGSLEPVPRHPDFRLFACMNPATDIGKKDLPPNIRARFTEIDVPPPDTDKETLLSIVKQYIANNAVSDKASIMNVAEFYQSVKALAAQRQIADGANHRPHYSIRTLARALTFASDIALTYGFPLRRALWEGCLMAFTMVLDRESAEVVTSLARQHILAGIKNPRSLLTKEPNVPMGRLAEEYIKFGPFYLERGPYPEDLVDEYVITPSVEAKLIDLARIVLTRRFPVLIEGPTSSGKTSAVEYLARRTGHQFVRINNHEHTDIQEYLGSYVSDPLTGKMVFKDGLLVQALRNGDWIVLDELNLAPTDVLEALNRLLDDNRELVVPETQEVVRPHPHFMLFATQNPPGLYAGRKVLSRAFRNRFLEVHFEDVPQAELETILCERCRIAPSYGKKIVAVFRELQKRRQTGRVFESKRGFATLRDLFRWAGRDAIGYQELAENGYMLIGERARREDDKVVVKEVIEDIMRVRIDEKALYSFDSPSMADTNAYLGCSVPSMATAGIVWTSAMQRLFTLVCRALKYNEPVLLVGETGSGKTSVCQVYADAVKQRLIGLNCHQNTETADLIGGLRPVRNRRAGEVEAVREVSELLRELGLEVTEPVFDALAVTLKEALEEHNLDEATRTKIRATQKKLFRLQSIFEWHDGPLVEAMQGGDVFLIDEISLADDSVLERLNSVLEPSRTIVLAEKGGEEQTAVKAVEQFKLVATMNPGGDYGKKELSPALRNRFTEIWVPPVEDRKDLELIISSLWKNDALKMYTNELLSFTEWLCSKVGDRSLCNLRDLLAWVTFTNFACQYENLLLSDIFHHAAHMTFLDGLGSLPQLSSYPEEAIQKLKADAEAKLEGLVPLSCKDILVPISEQDSEYTRIGPFAIRKGSKRKMEHEFNLHAPTTRDNAMRIARACQVAKPILLEGSPGVGKTSLVTALANVVGHQLCRINLSDQTDLIDLFGSDLPVEGGQPGEFAWRDAEFMKAMQEGHWVLLDEMNLAPQAVLEGLNAVLDHRGAVFIPELGRSFTCHPSFRIFAAQNPLTQGGGRKGLPKSFVNRFTKVYVEELSPNDLLMICSQLFPELDKDAIRAMIAFNMRLNDEVCRKRTFAREGSPWEFNLRDVIRWGYLLRTPGLPSHPVDHLRSIYIHRFRTKADRAQARALFDQSFGMDSEQLEDRPPWTISSRHIQVGYYCSPRRNLASKRRAPRILKRDLATLESIGLCISQSWPTILTGQQNCGKTEVVRLLAHFTGNALREISVNSATDTMDILGSFEQVDSGGRVPAIAEEILALLNEELRFWQKSRFKNLQEHRHALRLYITKQDATAITGLWQLCLHIVQEMNESSTRQHLLAQLDELGGKSSATGRFEWIDGPLVQAMKEGYWLLLDNANLCNPSVLDRLNSLCEPNGFLTLSERGIVGDAVQVIKPHPNFRLFMTVDSHYGELSRAMRNRGIEIALVDPWSGDDTTVLLDYLRNPTSIAYENRKACCLQFDHIRRGLHVQPTYSRLRVTPNGRFFDQDSALDYIVDQAPAVIKSTLLNAELTTSHLYFTARTMVPQYAKAQWRGTASSKDIRNFQEFVMGDAFIYLRHSLAVSRVVSSDFVPYQPMDFFLVNPTSVEKSSREKGTIVHHILLQVMDFAVIAFLHEKGLEEMARLSREASSEKSDPSPVFAAIRILSESIRDVSQSLLGSLSLTNWRSQPNMLQVLTKAMSYGTYLQRIIRNSALDYSALLALARCILDALNIESPQLITLQHHARSLNDFVSLTSGLGLLDIWSSLYCDGSLYLAKSRLFRLDELASSLNDGADRDGLRRRVLDCMTLTAVKVDDDEKKTALTELELELKHLHREYGKGHVDDRCIDSTFMIIELNLLSSYGFKLNIVKEIIDATVARSDSSLLRVATYRQMSWSIETGKHVLPLTVHTHLQWLHDVWELRYDNEGGDPAILLRPVLLRNTINLNDWKRRPLTSLLNYEEQIKCQARMILLQCEIDRNRALQLTSFLYQSLLQVAQCLNRFHPGDLTDNKCRGTTTIREIWASILEIISFMEQSRHQSLAQAVRRFIRPVIDTFTSSSRQDFPDAMLGECWVAISLTLFELIVPSSPIDPAAVQSWTSEYLKDNAQNLSAQVALHQALEQLLTGNPSNGVLQYLQTQLETLLSQAPDNVQYPIRKDLSRLHAYWSEVSQFCNQLLARDKLYDLIALLGRGSEEGTLREHVIQESIGGFYQRLDAAYADFTDINVLLKLPILYLRFGLRLIARQAAVSNIDDHSRFSAALIVYPSLIDSSVFGSKMNSSLPSVPAIQHAILQLATVTFEKSIGVDLDTRINDIDISCQQALRLWFIDRAKEQERDEVANSLYRHTTTYDGLSEAEIEKQEFLALFPSFEDVLSQEVSMSSDDKAHSSKHVQAEDMIRIVDIHVHLLENSGSPATDAFDETRMSFLNRLLRIPTMPASLDDQSLPLQLSMLRSGLSRFRQSSERKEVHNFYLDSNALEAKKGFATVQALRLRLDSLIQEWPEQMILQQLRAKCDALLSLGIGDPLAKLLAALEQLLMQTEDWEMYANKGTSLISYQRSLTDIIVEWRRLELSCWHILLNSQAKTFASESSVWWFRLYETCINGALSACEQESNLQSGKLSEFLLDLIPLLDDYITSSPLGQFHARLRILQTIERYVAKLKNTRPEYQQIGLARVQRVLYATGRRFGLYSLNMDNSLREQRAVLEKEVQEYIKLASWRDVNVRALKASAQRTHHQLFKVIRKFREILKQAVWGRLQPELAGEIETMPLDDFGGQRTSTSDLSGLLDEPDANAKPHLYQLKRTFTRYDNLITTRMRLFIRASMPQCADNLAIKIILTARELSNTTIPTAAPTERREKQRKALLVRKRKAWNDLLKELKRAGFSANPKPSILQNLSDECWLREQPILVDDDSKKLSTEKIEIYFSRLQVLMDRLRVLLPNHHPDITTRELQRGIMLLQSGFSLAIDLRRGLAGAMDRFNKLLKSSRRLRMLAEHPNIVAFGSDVIHRLRFIKDVLCRLSSCLREVSQGMVTFNELKSKPSIPEGLLRGVENEVEKTIMMRDRLAAILQSVQLSTQAVLLEVEYECVMEACRQISDIPGRLQDWSQRQPQIGYLVRPIIEWITSQDLSLTLSRSSVQPAEDLADRLIDNLLVVVQSLLPHSPEDLAVNLEDDDHYIVQQYQSVRDLTFLLKLDVISTRVDDLIANLASKTDGIGKSLQRTIPFIEVYICLAEDQMERHCQWTKALFKLDYVISSIIHSLLEKGFCKPPDADDTEDSADMEDVVDGVGLGEGMGTKNISIEIEDESQVEGLKEEEGVDRERNKMNEDEEAIEMDDDIGGEMEDVPQEDSKDEEPEFDDSDADPEERLGKLDASDPSAVDEKLWGDESGPDNSDEADDKANRDRAEEKVGKPEVVAKEGKREAQDKKKEKEGEDAPESIGTQEEIEQMEQEIETHENEEPNVSGAPMDDYVPDADTLDLPEDLNLEEDREMESLDGEQEERQEEVPEDFGGDMDDINDQGPAEDDGMGLDGQAGGEMTEQNEPGVEEEDGLGKDVVAQADITAGQGGADTVQPADGGCQEHQQSGMQENDTVGGPGEAEAALEEVKQQTMHHSIEGTQPRIQQQFIALSAAGTGSQQGQGNGESEVQTETNPLRSLGDARKEVRQRFDEILGGENREVQENIGDTSAPSQVEYLHPGDADYDMQALGPAGEDQVANLENLNLIDNDVGSPDVHPMDSNVTIQEQHDDALRPAFSLANIVSDATVPNDEPEGHDSDLIRKQLDMGLDLSRIDTEMEDQSSQSIEMQLVEWQSLGFPEEGGEHVWRRYESITHDLAYALCEQLRLILEPTLATRLKGDYRTGKRLNMKKIIPYIASDYTKDKIWLRRTRPSQREYQILIAIDDSRSMAESHSVHLAFQTLALVTKALSRLESGEIAIANFGEAVHMLHSFDDGQFTDQAGIKVISSFRFNQKATNVLSLIDTSLAVLESARERRSMSSATAGDLWQLEIIISDGLCQDHDQLRTLLRKAEEKRVMIVFVIVDSLHSVTNPPSAERATQNSILQMDKAEYRLVDGRMELQLRKYLDSFPFDYYVVLRNVEALPDVLAGTLKQFFERMSES